MIKMKKVNRMFKKLTILSLLMLLTTPLYAANVGDKAPNIFGRTFDGELFRLSAVAGPKLVNFFWVKCQPCFQELPELKKLEQKYPNVTFIAVHVNIEGEEAEAVQAFIAKVRAAPEKIVLSSKRVQENFDFSGLPHTVVIGADGIIKGRFEGYDGKKSIAKLEKSIKNL